MPQNTYSDVCITINMYILFYTTMQYSLWCVMSIGLNIVVVLIYLDIGLMAEVSSPW